MSGGKNNYNKIFMVIGGGAILILVLIFLGWLNMPTLNVLGDGTKDSPNPTLDQPQKFKDCDTTTTPTVTFSVYDPYGNNLTTDYNVWFKLNNVEYPTQAASTAINASAYDVISYRMIDKDGTHDVYGFAGVYEVPCREVVPVELKNGMQDTAISTTMYNTSAGSESTEVTPTAPEAVGAGATTKGKVYIAATTNDGVWSTSEEGRELKLIFDYNSIVNKQPKITSITAKSGSTVTFERADAIPSGHTKVVTSATDSVLWIVKTDSLDDMGNLAVYFEAEPASGTTNVTGADGNIGLTGSDNEMVQLADRSWKIASRNPDNSNDLGETDFTDVLEVS